MTGPVVVDLDRRTPLPEATSWLDPLLAGHDAALCLYDYAGRQAPLEVAADFVYIRLHEPGGPYQGSYSDQALAAWAGECAAGAGA